MENGGQIYRSYTEFEKAFDKVPHERLMNNILSSCEVPTVLNGQFSQCYHVLSGIPQGSVLGPLLFVLYINDLSTACASSPNLLLLADDAKICAHVTSDSDIEYSHGLFEFHK